MQFSNGVLRHLVAADWPGNVRQLRNEVMRLAACTAGNVIGEEDLWEAVPAPPAETAAASSVPARSLKEAVEELEKRMIGEALAATRNNQQQAARQLGLSRQGLINKMKRYGIQ